MSIFENSEILNIKRYPNEPMPKPWEGLENKILTAIFKLSQIKFLALDGGDYFKFNPSVSLFVNCSTLEEVDKIFNKLAEGGSILMPLAEYPFSKRYGWLSDKYGLSWQIHFGEGRQRITPAFLFVGEMHGRCEEAINFYTSIFKNSKINQIARYEKGEPGEEGKIKYSSFDLEGQQFIAMESNLPHKFSTNGAISQYVECETQEEVDYYWEKLREGSNQNAEQCGWLQDKFGFSWQIIPKILGEYILDPDKEKSDRVFQAMLKMKKIDIEVLERAYRGESQ
jgi:predicted 3-demethylubiquinone-9 3-methyltransferase (glyoxalase superfamily)